MSNVDADILRSLGPTYLTGPVYLGAALDQTGQIVLYHSSSVLGTTIQSGNATAAITYTLPTAGPAGNNYLLAGSTTGTMSWLNGPGTYAPIGSSYVTISTDATLTAERVLTGTANQIVITDNGANSTVVLSLPQSIATSSTPTFGGMTLTGPLIVPSGSVTTTAVHGASANVGLYFTGTSDANLEFGNGGNRMLSIRSSTLLIGTSTWEVDLDSSGMFPLTDNSIPSGKSGSRWTAVWAVNGTIQTSHSSRKKNIKDLDVSTLPSIKGISFEWEDAPDTYLGFLADDLPTEAYALLDDGTRSEDSVYTSAVIGILAAQVAAHEDRIAALEKKK